MNGLEAWAATFPATLAIAGCTLVLGVLCGWLWGTAPRRPGRRERRRLMAVVEDRAAARAAGQFRRMRVPELHHERRTSTAAFLDPAGSVFAAAMTSAAGQGREAWLAHCEQAIDLANDERTPDGSPIDTGEIQAITGDMDVFLARLLAEHPAPWTDGGEQ